MSGLFLIVHKVRGEAAFDVAEQMPCPECFPDGPEPTCSECDGLGYWWIVGTSGHRAYPCSCIQLSELRHDPDVARVLGSVLDDPLPVMEGLPDHYLHTASPEAVRKKIEDLLSALPPKRSFGTIPRR